MCEATVDIARIAPSEVDMLAATIPIKVQAPITFGATFVKTRSTAWESGSHCAHVGKSMAR